MPDSDGYATSLEMLADYECPECGPLIEDPDEPMFTEDEATKILGGDANGFLRCPDCGEELEPTLAAALDMLKLVAERFPEMTPTIAKRIEGAGLSSGEA